MEREKAFGGPALRNADTRRGQGKKGKGKTKGNENIGRQRAGQWKGWGLSPAVCCDESSNDENTISWALHVMEVHSDGAIFADGRTASNAPGLIRPPT